jgi:hypothetical protein
MRLRKFHVRMQISSIETTVDRWVLATSRRNARHVAERIYPFLIIVDVGQPEAPNPAERRWWRFRRWTRPADQKTGHIRGS